MYPETPPVDSRSDLPTDPEDLAGFELKMPNGLDDDAIKTLVDRVLAAHDACEYAAEYRSSNIWGARQARYLGTSGEPTYLKRTYDGGIDWRSIARSRSEVRTELIRRLSSATSRARNHTHDHYVAVSDEFVVQSPAEFSTG